MRICTAAAVAASLALFSFTATSTRAQSVPGKWTQTWADEFNTGASDLTGWTHETGDGGWGNNELENYTSDAANASVSGGNLHIKAIATKSGANTSYTSARLTTSGLFSQAYGVIEFRAKMPAGQGLWPAMWMMPQGSTYGGWPNSGEIDVFESKGQDTKLVQGSLHTGHDSGAGHVTQTATFADSTKEPANFATTDWHTYDIEWQAGTATKAATLTWYVDGVPYESQTGGWVTPNGTTSKDAPFDKPFYVILNMAVGGNYVGDPALAPGSYDMQVDYVRAYTASVPEPASIGLMTIGAMAALRRRR